MNSTHLLPLFMLIPYIKVTQPWTPESLQTEATNEWSLAGPLHFTAVALCCWLAAPFWSVSCLSEVHRFRPPRLLPGPRSTSWASGSTPSCETPSIPRVVSVAVYHDAVQDIRAGFPGFCLVVALTTGLKISSRLLLSRLTLMAQRCSWSPEDTFRYVCRQHPNLCSNQNVPLTNTSKYFKLMAVFYTDCCE